jgi:hypothetical protein
MAHSTPCLALWAALLAVTSTHTYSQAAVEIAAGPLVELVKGKTLAISFYGDPADPAATYLWDFKADGSICARIIGAKRSDKCAEEGKWSTNGAFLCWELPNMGKSLGTNPACSSFLQLRPDRYELRNKKTPDLKFAIVQVLR